MKAVWAFDFDGVICDSVGGKQFSSLEGTKPLLRGVSAYNLNIYIFPSKTVREDFARLGVVASSSSVSPIEGLIVQRAPSQAAARVWPDIFNADQALQKKRAVLDQMREARPVIETG